MDKENAWMRKLKEVEEKNKSLKKIIKRVDSKVSRIESAWKKFMEDWEKKIREERFRDNVLDEEMEKMKNEMAKISLDYELVIEGNNEILGVNKGSIGSKKRRCESPPDSSLENDEGTPSRKEENSKDESMEEDYEGIGEGNKGEGLDKSSEEEYKYKVIIKKGWKKGNIENLEKLREEIGIGKWKESWIGPETKIIWLRKEEERDKILKKRDEINGDGWYAAERFLNREEKEEKRKLLEFAREARIRMEKKGLQPRIVKGDTWIKMCGWIYRFDRKEGRVVKGRKVGEYEWLEK